jgi:hypothetical protein
MNGRDKRRKVKKQRAGGEVLRSQNANPAGLQPLPRATEPIHGKYCRVRRGKIDISVCTVQSVRTPDLCRGCE